MPSKPKTAPCPKCGGHESTLRYRPNTTTHQLVDGLSQEVHEPDCLVVVCSTCGYSGRTRPCLDAGARHA